MRNFIRRLAFIALMIIILAPILLIGIWYFTKETYYNTLIMDDDIKIIVCSDSQTEVVMNPKYYDGLRNLSRSGGLVETYYFKLIDIMKMNPGRSFTFLLDISPQTLFYPYEDLEETYAVKFAELYAYHANLRNFRKWSNWTAVDWTRRRFKDLFRYQSYNEELQGGYMPLKRFGFINNRARVDKTKKVFLDWVNEGAPVPTEDDVRIIAIRNFITLAQKHNHRVILMTTPLHQEIRDGIIPERTKLFDEWLNRFANDYNIPWLNYDDHPFPDNFWADGNHLNILAEEPFAKLVIQDLKAIESNSSRSLSDLGQKLCFLL